MTLLEMMASLRVKIGKPTPEQVPNTELREHVNDALIDLATRYRNFGTRSTTSVNVVDGDDEVALDKDVGAIIKVRLDSTGKFLRRGGLSTAAEWLAHPDGKPRAYMRYGNNLRVFPIPSATYALTIYHKSLPPRLVDDTDEPTLPSDWHPGIVLRARWYYWDGLGDVAKATYAHQAFQLWMADKPSEAEEEMGHTDAGVELPELRYGYGSRLQGTGRYDDGTFDYRE